MSINGQTWNTPGSKLVKITFLTATVAIITVGIVLHFSRRKALPDNAPLIVGGAVLRVALPYDFDAAGAMEHPDSFKDVPFLVIPGSTFTQGVTGCKLMAKVEGTIASRLKMSAWGIQCPTQHGWNSAVLQGVFVDNDGIDGLRIHDGHLASPHFVNVLILDGVRNNGWLGQQS